MHKNLGLIVIAFSLSCSIPIYAQWTQTNWSYHGWIYSLAVSGSNLFAGTEDAVYLSTNDGTSWTKVLATDFEVRSLLVSGTNIFAGTIYGGLFMSTNSGTSWSSIGLSGGKIYALAVAGSNLYAGNITSVYRTTNNGANWSSAYLDPGCGDVYTLAATGATVLAGTQFRGLFRSTDNGSTWNEANAGLPSQDIRALVVSGSKVYAATNGKGIYVSTNDGVSWNPLNTGIETLSVLSLAVNGSALTAGIWGGGAFLSTNNGSSWSSWGSGLASTSTIYALAVKGTSIFAGAESGGVWRRPLSEMIGTSGATLNAITPLSIVKGNDFTVEVRVSDSAGTANVFGLSFELLYTNSSYVDFVSADLTGSYLGGDLTYLLSPSADGKVSVGLSRKAPLAGVSGGGTVLRFKFHVSPTAPDNGMVDFNFANVLANDQNGISIFLSPVSATTTIQGLIVWPGDADNNGVVSQGDILPLGLYWGSTGPPRSNASLQWRAQSAAAWKPPAATYADANGDGIVNQADVLPIGLNWGKAASLGKVGSSNTKSELTKEASEASTPVLWATGPVSIRGKSMFDVTVTIGDTMNPVSSLFGISFLLDFASSKNIIQVTGVNAGSFLGNDVIFFSQIDTTKGLVAVGVTRKRGAANVAGFGRVASVRFQVINNTSNSSFMLSTHDITANDAGGNPIAVQPASTSILVSVNEINTVPNGFRLEQNYPNPFNPSTRISFSIPLVVRVGLTILDVIGREVATLIEGERTAGAYEVEWNASNVPSGTYFCRLRAGEFVLTRKMLLLK